MSERNEGQQPLDKPKPSPVKPETSLAQIIADKLRSDFDDIRGLFSALKLKPSTGRVTLEDQMREANMKTAPDRPTIDQQTDELHNNLFIKAHAEREPNKVDTQPPTHFNPEIYEALIADGRFEDAKKYREGELELNE